MSRHTDMSFLTHASYPLPTPQVHKKIEVRGGEKKELNFLLMESSPGVNDVYVPKNIFTGHDRSVWDGIKVKPKTKKPIDRLEPPNLD